MALLAAALVAACGGASAMPPAWRAGHPDPSGMTFDEDAPGICALTVRYADLAPAAIEYQGATYVQRTRAPAPAMPPGQLLGRSAGWAVVRAGSDLAIDAGTDLFTYRLESTC